MFVSSTIPAMASARQRSTRDRPAKPPLSEEAVVDAALAILKAEGLEAVTMRRVAAALDTGAASLYVYLSGRDALLEAMLDRVTAGVRLEAPDPARWRDQLHSLLGRMHDALLAHPGIAAITLGDPPTTEAVLRLTENLLGILLAGGLDPQDAAWGCDLLVLLVTAAAREDEVRRPGAAADTSEIHATFAGLSPDRFPNLAAHAAQMVAGDGGERFTFAVDVVIDGLLASSVRRWPPGAGARPQTR
jgi:AcrR family transcriptional regulator